MGEYDYMKRLTSKIHTCLILKRMGNSKLYFVMINSHNIVGTEKPKQQDKALAYKKYYHFNDLAFCMKS